MIVELLSNPVLTILCFVIIPFLTSMINSTSYADSFGNSKKFEPVREKTNNFGTDQVQHKPVTEDC